MADISRYMKPILGDDECVCGYYLPVGFVDGNCELVPPGEILTGGETGGDDPPPAGGAVTVSGDLEVYCDADQNLVFVKIKTLDDGTCVYTNPADGSDMTPMVDFFPCPVPVPLVFAGVTCYEE